MDTLTPSPQNRSPAFSLEKVAFRYADAGPWVLRDLSFTLPTGKITAILGPNGAGKSTLLHLLLGLLTPQQGHVRLFGRPLAAYPPSQRGRWVAWVPQKEHLTFAFTVREYVLLGRTPHLGWFALPRAEDMARVEEVLAQLGLRALAARSIHDLSGGEVQLMLIARALAQESPVLLLDEPTAHLDPGNRARVLAYLKALAAQGRTLVFTTHEPQAAAQVAHQVLLLREGRLLFAGSPEQALTPERLSALYGIPFEVHRCQGRTVIWPA